MWRVTLSGGVGHFYPNLQEDVAEVQRLLNEHSMFTGMRLTVDGYFNDETWHAVRMFQSVVLGMQLPDGMVEPHGLTIERLQQSSIKPMLSSPVVPPATGKTATLTEADYSSAAATLKCEVAAIKAVADVETGPQGAFDKQGRPTILYERHYFHRLTNKKYDKTHPDLSSASQGPYGKFSAQYLKLERACLLDREAALMSASWGAFQIMGANYKEAGYASVDAMVIAMRRSIQDHLQAFIGLIGSKETLLKALRDKNWPEFAKIYNGPQYAEHGYDTRLAKAYETYKK